VRVDGDAKRVLGIYKNRGDRDVGLCRYEVELISQFLPQAAVALQNARRAELARNKTNAMAERSMPWPIWHEAFHRCKQRPGRLCFLVQQLRDELEQRRLTRGGRGDCRQVEHSIQVCRRHLRRDGFISPDGRSRTRASFDSPRPANGRAGDFPRAGGRRRGAGWMIDVRRPAPLFAVQADVRSLAQHDPQRE